MIRSHDNYLVNTPFITNYAELMNIVSVNTKNSEPIIIKELCTYCSLRDNFDNQHIMEGDLNKNAVKTGFADLSNLEVKEE